VCKKWHVAKRLAEKIRQIVNVPTVEFLFDEEHTVLPDLGGIQSTLDKRGRHHRALMRMLFDYHETGRLLICLDPNNVALMHDFYADGAKIKMLEIKCEFSDDYLIGHAKRVGLAGDHTSAKIFNTLLPTIRYDVVFESDRIRDADFSHHYRIRESASVDENTTPLSEFLDISHDKARQIVATDHLFTD